MPRNEKTRVLNRHAAITIHSGMLMHRVDLRYLGFADVVGDEEVADSDAAAQGVPADKEIQAFSVVDAAPLHFRVDRQQTL